jgi:hypothetical protein
MMALMSMMGMMVYLYDRRRSLIGSYHPVYNKHQHQNKEYQYHGENGLHFLPRHAGTLPGTMAGFKVELYPRLGGI